MEGHQDMAFLKSPLSDDNDGTSMLSGRALSEDSSMTMPTSADEADNRTRVRSEKKPIKRPMNSFMVYAQEHRHLLKQKYPHKDNKAISKLLGDTWLGLSQEARQPYIDESVRIAEQHRIEHPGWKFKRQAKKKPNTKKGDGESTDKSISAPNSMSSLPVTVIQPRSNATPLMPVAHGRIADRSYYHGEAMSSRVSPYDRPLGGTSQPYFSRRDDHSYAYRPSSSHQDDRWGMRSNSTDSYYHSHYPTNPRSMEILPQASRSYHSSSSWRNSDLHSMAYGPISQDADRYTGHDPYQFRHDDYRTHSRRYEQGTRQRDWTATLNQETDDQSRRAFCSSDTNSDSYRTTPMDPADDWGSAYTHFTGYARNSSGTARMPPHSATMHSASVLPNTSLSTDHRSPYPTTMRDSGGYSYDLPRHSHLPSNDHLAPGTPRIEDEHPETQS